MSQRQALIVEDALNWAKQHQLALDDLDFKTAVANDYAEALGLLRRERFDVAIIDLCLTTQSEPENLNGVFLLQYLSEKSVPVIVVTGHGPRKLVDKIYQNFEVFAILDKLSFNPEKFKEYVLQATRLKPAATEVQERKKTGSPKKIEALVDELIQSRGAASKKRESDLPEHRISQTQGKSQLKVFISHSAKDKSLAGRLALDLRATGLEVWYDSDEIHVGDTILEKIEQGTKSDLMIIILSPDSVASWMVKQELLMFLNEERRRGSSLILPILYKDCQIPPLLEGRHYADFRESYEAGFAELQASLVIGQNHTENM
jgi:CheY-like chemotaxis protein